MNKLNKIGISALCGSLAAFSAANAGDLTVSGGADMTYVSKSGQVTGNPLGIGSNYTLSGSGDLDNGWNVALSIAMTNANAYSNANVTIGIPGLGDVRFDQGVSGTGIQRMDDMTPSVWEEADGAGLSATINKISGASAGANIEITPSEVMPAGLTGRAVWSADADSGSTVADKASGGTSGIAGSGWDLTLEASSDFHGVDGLTVYGGLSEVKQYTTATTVSGDREENVIGIKYAMGGFTFGYQQSDEDTGLTAATSYENTAYSVTFSVNDDLSVGYNHVESEKDADPDDAEADSFQAAYTMGGATFRIAEVDVENAKYSTAAANDLDATIISLGLAF